MTYRGFSLGVLNVQRYFYNLVDPRQVAMYGRPANATNDALWQQAVRENPDPSWFVRSGCTGC